MTQKQIKKKADEAIQETQGKLINEMSEEIQERLLKNTY